MIFIFFSYHYFCFKIILLSLNRSLYTLKNRNNKKYNKTEANPFVKGAVLRATVITPKKPNSARRAVVKSSLVNRLFTIAYIPGIGHNLRKHSLVLIRGGGARDLPMVNYSCVRNKYDLNSVANRLTRRSSYGVKRNSEILHEKKKFKRI